MALQTSTVPAKPLTSDSTTVSPVEPVKTAQTTPNYNFDEAIIKAKIASLTKSRDDQAGKPGINPFLWYRDNVASKVAAFEKGDRTKEVYDSIMATKEFVGPTEAK